ncbi:hypothetical protein Tco_0290680 [Tanacetum coccineum]
MPLARASPGTSRIRKQDVIDATIVESSYSIKYVLGQSTIDNVVKTATNLSAAGIMLSMDPFIIGLQLNPVPMSLFGIIIPSANNSKERPLMEQGSINELIDPRLGNCYSAHELCCMMQAAYLCIRRYSHLRSRMPQVDIATHEGCTLEQAHNHNLWRRSCNLTVLYPYRFRQLCPIASKDYGVGRTWIFRMVRLPITAL